MSHLFIIITVKLWHKPIHAQTKQDLIGTKYTQIRDLTMDVLREVIESKIFGSDYSENIDDAEFDLEPDLKRKQPSSFKTVDIFGHVHENARIDDIFKHLGNAFLALEPTFVYSSLCPCHDIVNVSLFGDDKSPYAITLPKPLFTTADKSDLLENLIKLSESCDANSKNERQLPKYRIPACNIADIAGIDFQKILSDVGDVLFPIENGIRAELVEMLILQPMAPFSHHEEIEMGPKVIGGVEIILPSLYLGGWVEMLSPIHRNCEINSYKFFDERVYEKMKAKESGYTSQHVIKFSTPTRVLGIFAWNRKAVFGPVQILAGVRISLLFKLSKLEPVTSMSTVSPANQLYMHNQPQPIAPSITKSVGPVPVQIAMANSSSSMPTSTQKSWIIRTIIVPKLTEYFNHTVRELKTLCRDLHLSCSGTKDELIARLMEKERLRMIDNCSIFKHDSIVKVAEHFGHVLLSALRNGRFVPDRETNFRLAFPCRHLYEREEDLPSLLKAAENLDSVKTSQLFLKGADAVLATVALHAGLKVRMIRVGCIEIHSPTNLSTETQSAGGNQAWQNTTCYFPFPFLPVIRSIPQLLSIKPVVVENRLIPVLTVTDTVRSITHALNCYNAKGEKNIPLENLHWAVNLPRISEHHTVCLPSFMPLQFIAPPEESSVHHQNLIPEAPMYETYIRLSASHEEKLCHGRIFFQCAIVVEIPGMGSEERYYCIDELASWLASPISMHQAIDIVRAGDCKEIEENTATTNLQTDLTRYKWLDIHSAQNIAREYDVDTHGTTKAILNRLNNRIASLVNRLPNSEIQMLQLEIINCSDILLFLSQLKLTTHQL